MSSKVLNKEELESPSANINISTKQEIKPHKDYFKHSNSTKQESYIDDYLKITLMKANKQSEVELEIKESVSKFTMFALTLELILSALFFYLAGAKKLIISDNLMQVYIVSIVGQVISTFYLMVKYLFDPNRISSLKLAEEIIKANNQKKATNNSIIKS